MKSHFFTLFHPVSSGASICFRNRVDSILKNEVSDLLRTTIRINLKSKVASTKPCGGPKLLTTQMRACVGQGPALRMREQRLVHGTPDYNTRGKRFDLACGRLFVHRPLSLRCADSVLSLPLLAQLLVEMDLQVRKQKSLVIATFEKAQKQVL